MNIVEQVNILEALIDSVEKTDVSDGLKLLEYLKSDIAYVTKDVTKEDEEKARDYYHSIKLYSERRNLRQEFVTEYNELINGEDYFYKWLATKI